MKIFFLSLVVAVCLIRFSSALVKEVNLFTAVSGITGNPITVTGVSRTTGSPHSSGLALLFKDKTPDLIANAQALADAGKLIHESHDFIVSAYTKIDPTAKYANNPILSISSQNGQRHYLLVSMRSTSRGKLTLEFRFYTKGDFKSVIPNIRTSIDVTKWHKIQLRVQDTEKVMKVFVDDELVTVQMFDYTFESLPSNAQLRLAQSYQSASEGVAKITDRFRGALQDVKIALGSKQDCKAATTPAPCKFPVPGGNQCIMGGVEYKEGDQWRKDNCTRCLCRQNQIICVYTCQVCKDGDKVYLHGDTWHPSNNKCEICKCESGTKTCSLPPCPKPDCSGKSGRTLTLPGECCPICVEDQCRGTGKDYKKCGCTQTCSNNASNNPCTSPKCKEGCFCPKGSAVNNGKCVSLSECKCVHNGKNLEPGETVYSSGGCDVCTCIAGSTKCISFCG